MTNRNRRLSTYDQSHGSSSNPMNAALHEAAEHPQYVQIMQMLRQMMFAGVEIRDPQIVLNVIGMAEREPRPDTFVCLPRNNKHMRSGLAIPEGRHDPVVYYLQLGTMLKIGTSTHLTARLEQLAVKNVLAIEPGSYALEHVRHVQFRQYHETGEWFHLKGALKAFVDRMIADSSAA